MISLQFQNIVTGKIKKKKKDLHPSESTFLKKEIYIKIRIAITAHMNEQTNYCTYTITGQ